MPMDYTKYRPFPTVESTKRKWPSNVITKAPIWCSVDLRDGNQSLEYPMTFEQKINFFKFLVAIGFKEIEVGFPSASETEFMFVRKLIEDNLIPEDVTIQVLTQARPHIIERTFESLVGVNHAIVHFYNSTSELQRRVVFNKDMEGIEKIAVESAELCVNLAEKYGKERFLFEYSPESFTGTELDFSVKICQSVLDTLIPSVYNKTMLNKVMLNLPSTVEMATPNVYADQVEYVVNNLKGRENVIISLHAHNDRGCAVAATELGLMAGADRVEGTLFGNGERTGNADILTLAMNMYSQGIDCKLDFSVIDNIVNEYEQSTRLSVHPRHPYAGSLVYTAFSGGHQDAINKGMAYRSEQQKGSELDFWEVPYLPIDPVDVGRTYDPIIRINSQSGGSGVSYVLEYNYGLHLPKPMQRHFGRIVTKATDSLGKDLSPKAIYQLFTDEYVNISQPLSLVKYSENTNGKTTVVSDLTYNGKELSVEASGEGLIEAFTTAVAEIVGVFEVVYYHEHSMEYGTKSRAITYVIIARDGKEYFGAGVSGSISKSSLRAVVSAVNKMFHKDS